MEAQPVSAVTQKPGTNRNSPAVDRRKHRRFKLNAAVTVRDLISGKSIEAKIEDICLQGCHVATCFPFPLGTTVEVTIAKGEKSCAAGARVAYVQEQKGIGLLFTEIEAESSRTLSTWIQDAHESEWLALIRQGSQRMLLKIPLRVFMRETNEPSFKECTETKAITSHGAVFLLSQPVDKGRVIYVANVRTGAAAECTVVHVRSYEDKRSEVGVEFRLPNPRFWSVSFPPRDWSPRHPDAKRRKES
jgi:PilZ domain